ncbi:MULTISPECIES: DUF4167 domain-containing protein [Bradyrhizobium]|uniref:DUF4167 domain-containing protein n=1 Tax=Bradyrhizobium brasilense TaxID=1419277 RepID=A0ABY8JGK1_9BRAD|nr:MULTISPECIES: DUF4167 domain-containing protein [Bradyrhizobium]MCA1400091.1 DUF4167 domain-containing protein [Bradyrhizobium sp. BRP56]MCP1837010.1 hypothetical protein [Bradyrhizobium sp. USDA 4545]MCP1921758.1 hypothetical protein [Bradyrhizobium sp. USDA 4532]OMI14941.1 hypothetical protein BSN85_03760 [Bradyrhizobium brasilense]WFU63874.1 DUF4167 domain-containing protein [Bradyrhizobium brasilense]
MRNGQNNKRMRNRNNNNNNNNNNRRGQNPLTRVYESNGPDIKIRGTASHVAEKYVQLARDARSSGDPVAAENYYQHAEHYYRIIAAAQEQFRQNQQPPRPDAEVTPTEDGDDDSDGYSSFGQEPGFVPQQQQPFMRDNGQQPYQREQQQPREHRERDQQPREHREREHRPQPQYQPQPQNQPQPAMADAGGVDRLPSFITGGAQPQVNGAYEGNNGGAERGERSERFPRRRRRPHGPRPDMATQPAPSDDFNPGNE